MKKGVVYWITGLPGSGKTTVGNALYYKMRKGSPVILLDGDILKSIVSEVNPGYTQKDRLLRARKYSLLCKMISDQGIDVIICTVAMFEDIRIWNRNNFAHYIEIFLNVSMDVLRKRDRKKLYSNATDKDSLPGLHYDAEFPQNPDIVLNTDGTISVAECVERILDTTYKEKGVFNSDTTYWNAYYQKKPPALDEPSSFAKEMLSLINAQNSEEGEIRYLLDLGCGNGRDSCYFAENGIHVVGIDASDVAIEILEQSNSKNKNLEFMCDDFVTASVLFQREYDYCYSRFTLHAINELQEKQLLDNVYKALKKNGLFMIEARTIHDQIYGLGELVERNAYLYNDHYRRFIDPEELLGKVEKIGFQVIFSQESNGYSKTDTEDPVLLRLVLKK